MSNLDVVGDGKTSNDFATIPDVPVNAATDRVKPNQVASGVTRGTQLYYDANGIPSIVIGVLPDGTNGLVIAKPGQNVLDTFV